MTEYNKDLAALVKGWLDNEEFNYDFDEENGRFFYSLNVKGKVNPLRYVIGVAQNLVVFYAVCPLRADEQYLPAAAEFVNRANYGLNLGCFELDHNDGEIRYRIGLNCDGTTPSKAVLDDCFYLPASMFERYGEGLASVLFGFDNPKEAVEKIEKAMLSGSSGNDSGEGQTRH